ncbi:aminoacyl-tRNA hydrolase [Corynebacterium uterequi]|uniref:Peptidyl-tRNA hydrolase n=1 Tax=Corynebacterium uterequi TaxID=1072256 RepID=A0A0G3HDH1_9CORY|nr:aminoacyl-tRNA hydrolase [Corynebacterium uterequi]AKK10745.1 aminoacyl-tRNA hydrolase [Corynebacterium uterequi]
MTTLLRPFSREHTTPEVSQPPAPHWVVLGLGNPGKKYAPTRHNVGYLCVDELLAPRHASLSAVPGVPALATSIALDGQPCLAARSTTYMNSSGEAAAALLRQHALPPEQLIVVHDELDLPAGVVRIKLAGNENGHNGLKSITEHLGTRDYIRVRIGVGRPPAGTSVPDWVLSPMMPDASGAMPNIQLASEAVTLIVSGGVAAAQNTVHAR